MRIQTNVDSLNAYRNLNQTNRNQSKSMERLSSGFRINRAADDAAGLAISEKMRGQISGLNQAVRNAQDSISMIQTAEGALNETHEILQRMRELAVQSANDTNTNDDRVEIQEEINQLTAELDRISDTTEFNTQKLLNGNLDSAVEELDEIGFAQGVSGMGGAEFIDADGNADQISLDADGDLMNALNASGMNWASESAASGQATIKISKDNDGNMAVDISVTNSSGNTIFTSSGDSVTAVDGNFNYNNHGIEFSLEEDELDKIDTGGGTIDLLAIGSGITDQDIIQVGSDWNVGALASGGASISNEPELTNFSIDGGDEQFLDESKSIKIEINPTSGAAAGSGGSITVTIHDVEGGSGGNVLSTDTFDIDSLENGELSYDNHGISFDLDPGDLADFAVVSGASTFTHDIDTDITGRDGGLKFHIGANEDQNIDVSMGDMSAEALKVGDLDLSTQEGANAAITTINDAIGEVSSQRSELGAVQNRLEHTIANLEVSAENLTAAESRIRDVDMANEMMEFSKQQILEQAGTSMLAQANQAPQSVLQLLG